jgi:hypothetical protein
MNITHPYWIHAKNAFDRAIDELKAATYTWTYIFQYCANRYVYHVPILEILVLANNAIHSCSD